MRGCSLHLAALIHPLRVAPALHRHQHPRTSTGKARDLEIDRVVHTSTSETYGTAQFVPITESHPVGQSPYAASKIGAINRAIGAVLRHQYQYYDLSTPMAHVKAHGPSFPQSLAKSPQVNAIFLGALSPTRDFNYGLIPVQHFSSGLA